MSKWLKHLTFGRIPGFSCFRALLTEIYVRTRLVPH